MIKLRFKPLAIIAITSLTLIGGSAFAAKEKQLANFNSSANGVFWNPKVNGSLTITVGGPDDFYVRKEITTGDHFSLDSLEDGSYSYEITLNPTVSKADKKIMKEARESNDMSEVNRLRSQGRLPKQASYQSGHFRIVNGSIPRHDLAE